jgi:hypothetical protein
MSVAAATPAVIGVARSNVGDLRAPYASPAVYVWGGDELHDQGCQVDLREMEAGDSIVIRTGEVVAVRVPKS